MNVRGPLRRPPEKGEGNKTRVSREEETDSEKDINELRVFYLFIFLSLL